MRSTVICTVVSGALLFGPARATPQTLRAPILEGEFNRLVQGFDGRVGVCAEDADVIVCVNPNQRFPLQSVMKLVVGLATLDAIDQRGWRLDDPVVIRKEDLSVGVQPLARFVDEDGFRTTVEDLVRRAIVDSDSAATDVLVSRLGGPNSIQGVLNRLMIAGVRIDRDERHLQTESWGLEWQPEFVEPGVLDRAYAAVPESQVNAAFQASLSDQRDTATPKGMVDFLRSLSTGKYLSSHSTKFLLDVMAETKTFPDRLKAGLRDGWTIAHKTGTGGTWNGIASVTNDVGIMTSPSGRSVSIAVFIAESRAPEQTRAALIAELARATIDAFR